jgi:hypothetical protein
VSDKLATVVAVIQGLSSVETGSSFTDGLPKLFSTCSGCGESLEKAHEI